ncbi:MAG: WbqC family protein [Arcobacteraceae bacterium]
MKIAIMQPTFNPWLGYFDLIDYVDEFIFLDTVQLNQQSWQTRNKIKVQNKELMFSLPIQKDKSKSELLIKDTILDFIAIKTADNQKEMYKFLKSKGCLVLSRFDKKRLSKILGKIVYEKEING